MCWATFGAKNRESSGDDLVELRPKQQGVARHVFHVVARDHHVAAFRGDDEQNHDAPAQGAQDTGQKYEARIEPQSPQPNEDKDVEKGGGLQIEGRGLIVLQVERPDQQHQQADVEQRREGQRPIGKPRPIRPGNPDHGQDEVDPEDVGHRLERGIRSAGLGRQEIEQPKGHDDGKLHPADQTFGAILLPRDRFPDTLRQRGFLGQMQ